MNVEEYEQLINGLNKQLLAGTITNKEIQAQMSQFFNEDLAYKLKNRLEQQVNGQISLKAKEHLSDRQYFAKRDELENQIIQSGFPYAFFSEEASLDEIEALRLNFIDRKTMMLIIISALKMYVDNELENDPKAQALHRLYLQLKQQLSSEIPFEEGDGFTEYLASKSERSELENTRVSGSICPSCLGHNVHSKGAEFQCFDCKKRWRKH